MPQITIPSKNRWGAAYSNQDQQRSDLFYVSLNYPAALGQGSSNVWESDIAFAVEQFPFPARDREMIGIKYLQQTNFQIGRDEPTPALDMQVRYAFNRRTAELLEQWHWLISNPLTGGVAITSAVKADGYFFWVVPSMAAVFDVTNPANVTAALAAGPKIFLEGCLPKNLKPTDANMTTSGLVNLTFTLQIDRYYPLRPSDLTYTANNVSSVA
jgi:hypothetical protein